MVGASNTAYEFNSVVRSQHVYKSVRTPLTDKSIMQEDNKCDKRQLTTCSNIQKEDAHIKRDIEDKLLFLNVWHHLNIYQVQQFCYLVLKWAQAFISFILVHYPVYI